jgi:RHS repeat-associated protein
LDKESGYYFYNARHYDPEIGRFVTADSIIPYETSTQSWNRFTYCSNNPIIYKDPTGHAEITKEQARVGDVMLRREGGKEQAIADQAGLVTKAAARVHNRIAAQTECKRGHSAIVKEAFKYKDQVVGVMVTDIVGGKIVDRLITQAGSAEWDSKKEKWTKFDKYETIDQYDFFRVGTRAEGEKAVSKLESAMKKGGITYDTDALFAAIGGKMSLITNKGERNLGKFKEGDNKMVCTELTAWAYSDDGKKGKLGDVFLALPDQIYQNQKMYDINGKMIPGTKSYDRTDVINEYNGARK